MFPTENSTGATGVGVCSCHSQWGDAAVIVIICMQMFTENRTYVAFKEWISQAIAVTRDPVEEGLG